MVLLHDTTSAIACHELPYSMKCTKKQMGVGASSPDRCPMNVEDTPDLGEGDFGDLVSTP